MGDSSQKTIAVGLLIAPQITFYLNDAFGPLAGRHVVRFAEGLLHCDGNGMAPAQTFFFMPTGGLGEFEVEDVVIGIGFHWERKENQRFCGSLRFICEQGLVRAINVLPIEEYLISVISSEMNPAASMEYLKAHTVISRSWLLYQIQPHRQEIPSQERTPEKWIRWWDRQDHDLFDVCADDHCQRYQGITRASASMEKVREAVESTSGEVLVHDGEVCDARFSKCCGGMMERFSTAWGPQEMPYLQGKYDGDSFPADVPMPDLSDEVQAQIWIRSKPTAFCNTQDKAILSQVLNSYDQETPNFYRWEVHYSFREISELVAKKIGEDLGTIQELIPLKRGTSGRIYELKLVGSRKTLILGKELMIRKALSESHLYSSAFDVEKDAHGFHLYGAGWGHGVGLCQIGGAVMASKGYSYSAILSHYYPNTDLKRIY